MDRDSAELERVWDLLLKRFDNEKRLVLSHVNRIINYPKLVTESAEELRKLMDTINQQLRLLQRFNYNTEGWSPLVVGFVLSKLDGVTHSKLKRNNANSTMPKMNELFNFLNRRIGALRNLKATCSAEILPVQSVITRPADSRPKYHNTGRNPLTENSSRHNNRDKRFDDRQRNWRADTLTDSMVYKKNHGTSSV